MLHLNLGKQEQVLLQLLRGEALPQLWDSMDQDPEPIAVIPGLEDPIRLGPTRWDQVDQWDQVVLVGLVQEDKDLATE